MRTCSVVPLITCRQKFKDGAELRGPAGDVFFFLRAHLLGPGCGGVTTAGTFATVNERATQSSDHVTPALMGRLRSSCWLAGRGQPAVIYDGKPRTPRSSRADPAAGSITWLPSGITGMKDTAGRPRIEYWRVSLLFDLRLIETECELDPEEKKNQALPNNSSNSEFSYSHDLKRRNDIARFYARIARGAARNGSFQNWIYKVGKWFSVIVWRKKNVLMLQCRWRLLKNEGRFFAGDSVPPDETSVQPVQMRGARNAQINSRRRFFFCFLICLFFLFFL